MSKQEVNLIPVKKALELWNEAGEINISYFRKNKEKSFWICTKGYGAIDKYFDVGLCKSGNRYFVDKDKLSQAINEYIAITKTEAYIKGKKEAYNSAYEEAHWGKTNDFLNK